MRSKIIAIALILTLAACSFRALAVIESEEAIRGELSITKRQSNENDPTALQKGIGSGITGVLPGPTPPAPVLVNP